METVNAKQTTLASPPEKAGKGEFSDDFHNRPVTIIGGIERQWIEWRVMLTILSIALHCYPSFTQALRAALTMVGRNKVALGSKRLRRCVKVDGRYYSGIYVPAFPSRRCDEYIRTELDRVVPHNRQVNRFQIVQLGMTTKCPLHCEHCFEWNNLHREEPFTTEELKHIISVFQKEGCTQFHFTGGEPMARVKCLEELIEFAAEKSECWVLTSGVNLTPGNAQRLKDAGATGVIISLDHYDARRHNTFRGTDHAFEWAIRAVRNAHHAKLVTAFSICITRSFVTEENLMQYADLAKACGVSFVQLLEPQAVGRYEGMPVRLSEKDIGLLDNFYIKINFNPEYRKYPVFIYHGYYQRRVGCLSAANRSLYIDSAGFINACPFCHTKNYDARGLLDGTLRVKDIAMGGCPNRMYVRDKGNNPRAVNVPADSGVIVESL